MHFMEKLKKVGGLTQNCQIFILPKNGSKTKNFKSYLYLKDILTQNLKGSVIKT